MPPIPGLGIDGKVMLPVEAPWKAELLGQLTRGASLSMRLCARVAVSRVSRTAKFCSYVSWFTGQASQTGDN